MSGTLAVCGIPDDLKEKLKKFRFKQSSATNALILRINKDRMEVEMDDSLENCTIDEICSELPVHQPRYIIISYETRYSDGRVSYPLCLVFHSPAGCSPEVQMLYAGSKNNLIAECQLTKNVEIRDIGELTEEFLNERFS